jgi:formylglycine-generating enzyme
VLCSRWMQGRAFIALGIAAVVGLAGCGLVANLSSDYTVAGAAGDAAAPANASHDGATGSGDGSSGSGSGSGDGGGGGDTGAGHTVDGGTVRCDVGTTGGPTMVAVTSTSGVSFCIDSTEVTQAQYNLFMATDAGGQPDPCKWNTTFQPDNTGDCQNYDFNADQTPMACIDWCDARAYCASVGKRLCGKVGGGGLAFALEPLDPAKDQWLAACSGGSATQVYPYGPAYIGGRCQDNTTQSAPVASHAACTGPVAGIFDQSGNVAEWQDSCGPGTPPQDQNCHTRGGDFTGKGPPDLTLQCFDVGQQAQRKDTTPKRGFRCCKD